MIAVNKAYRTRGGHTYHVIGAWTSLGRRYIRFESRCGGSSWAEIWPLERFLEAIEREPVESAQPRAESTVPGLAIPGPPELRAEGLRDAYQEIAWEIEGLAQLAGGTDPDDDLCDALAHLACAMKSLAAAREKALAEWAADGCAEPEPGCGYFATGVPISVGAPPEPDGLESALQKLGARATGAVPGERRLDPETFQEVEEAIDRAASAMLNERHVEPEEKP